MKKAFVSMLSITILLIMLVISAISNVSAQVANPTTATDSDMYESTIAPDYPECNLTEGQRSEILAAVLSENATFADYDITEMEYVYCHYSYGLREDESETGENVTYFYGTIRLMNSKNEPRYVNSHFNGEIVNNKITLTYLSKAWPQYNFESYFTEEENIIFDYYLKMLLIDYEVYGEHGDMQAWFRVNDMPVYRCLTTDLVGEEIARCPTPYDNTDWEKFKDEFSQYVTDMNPDDSFYYQNEWSSMGLVKTRLSEVRNLLNNWVTSIYFFGENLMFNFQGNVTVSANVDDILKSLSEQGFEVCSPEDSRCDYNKEKMAWYSPGMLGVYAHMSFGETYAYLNINGRQGETARLYAGLSGTDVDTHIDEMKAMISRVARILGIDVGDVEFEEQSYPEVYGKESPDGDGAHDDDEISTPPEPMIEESPYRMLTIQKEITLPVIDESAFSDWKKSTGMFYTNYFMDDTGITVGKPYISYWQKTDEWSYESIQIGEEEAYASVTIDSTNHDEAASMLSGMIGQFATITGEWNLEYYPIGTGGVFPVYRYGTLEARSGMETAAEDGLGGGTVPTSAPQAPSFENNFDKGFSELQGSVSADDHSFSLAPNVIGMTLVLIAGMASLIFLLLK